MATYIKTLKEDNGDITYPQTKAGAVLLNYGSDLETELSQYVTAEDIASTSALTPPVQTNMIADGAVTKAKINFSTLRPYWKVLVVSNNNHITVPGGYNFIRIRAFAVMPATDAGRMVINSNNREPGSKCYVNYFGRTHSQAAQGSFNQVWSTDGSAIAVAYLEAVNEKTLLRYVVDMQSYRTGKTLVSQVSCCTMGNDQNYILRGEANLNNANGDFDLHFNKGGIFPTEVHWVVEGLEEN